ncbi:MAG TPA: hypothetical protein VHA35_08325 [Dongiaceae bacterium]|jgi:hypothetical protein|nr:hypothetical protein [Dongiaceae bacterium]
MRLPIAGIALACGLISPALAQDSNGEDGGQVDVKPLTGSYYMAPPIDAEDPNAPADHVFITLTGDVAKEMWDAMKVEATPDECVGRMARWVQSLVCYGPSSQASQPLGPDESPYECYLGVNLKTAQLELGQDC